jgi:hypothetical protein
MRIISISTDVFAALWGRRHPGEENENAILERLLGLPKGPDVPPPVLVRPTPATRPPGMAGRPPNRFGVTFPLGFEIFRTYKGKEYRARAQEEFWEMNKRSYVTLLSLSRDVCDSNENPWMNWKYRNAAGKAVPLITVRTSPPWAPADKPVPGKRRKTGPRRSASG